MAFLPPFPGYIVEILSLIVEDLHNYYYDNNQRLLTPPPAFAVEVFKILHDVARMNEMKATQ